VLVLVMMMMMMMKMKNIFLPSIQWRYSSNRALASSVEVP
jgi:hypothetical protein